MSKRIMELVKKWKCPKCSFPENFLPTCSGCGAEQPKKK